MIIVFVHGWSVTHTDTYGGLPTALADQAAKAGINLTIEHVWIGRYVTFHDEVKTADIVVGFDRALRDVLAPGGGPLPAFSCISHSTGGPVVREWVGKHYGEARLSGLPLRHLIMLAPANHGSPLAVLGKARVGRIRAWFQGVEPGTHILEWLALGSADQWRLNRSWLNYDGPANGFYPFVLTGQTIDSNYYDFLNPYLVEVGSDGVVRAASANANYCLLNLKETEVVISNPNFDPAAAAFVLSPDGGPKRPRRSAFGVIPQASHSGTSIGIMRSVTQANAGEKPVVSEILKCLQVEQMADYDKRCADLDVVSAASQRGDEHSKNHRYTNLVFRIVDDQGSQVDDFDMYLLAGETFDPAKLPKGFFVDRQRNNETPNCLIYYVDYDVMATMPQEQFGLRVVPRPAEGFARYAPVEFRTNGTALMQVLRPNETIYVEVTLHRHVDGNLFIFDPANRPHGDFKSITPIGP